MLALDMRSFNLLAALQCAVLGLVLMGMQRNFPSRIQGLRLWALPAQQFTAVAVDHQGQ